MRESEERFRVLADLVPDLLWRGEPNGYATWFNQRWREYTGQTQEQAEGWGWLEAIHPEDREFARARTLETVDTVQPLLLEHRIRRHDGVYRWFLVRAVPVRDGSGGVQHWYGATDLDEQRRRAGRAGKGENVGETGHDPHPSH